MIVKHFKEVKKENVNVEGAKNTTIRWLLGEDSPAPNFYMRLFEVEPGGYSPYHTHSWEHEVFILEGEGKINTKGKSFELKQGSFVLVEPNEEHQFENTGNGVLKFLCMIPK